MPTAPSSAVPMVEAVRSPLAFSDSQTLVEFDGQPTGTPADHAFEHLGVRFELAHGVNSKIWLDSTPRRFGPSGQAALSNAVSGRGPLGVGSPDSECTLRIHFGDPVSRVGFEFRSCETLALNVLVSCVRDGVELGTLFFDIERPYDFVGAESAMTFDELRVELVNPARGTFSLDNLRFEADLTDGDGDGWPDFADPCPRFFDAIQSDSDGDGLGDSCDSFPRDRRNDSDGDGLGANEDNCPELFNPDQADGDGDGVGDACDSLPLGGDDDGDGIIDSADNCPSNFNPEQADCDGDGIGDLCDPTLIDPASLEVQLPPGGSITITKSVCLPPSPPKVDVVIAFDVTASMGGEIDTMRQNIVHMVHDVREALPASDIRFGLVTHRDYPDTYGSCQYSAAYGRTTDRPFVVDAPIGTSDLGVLQAVNALQSQGGGDQPESYTRVLWELTQPDSGVGFRDGAARVVLLLGDAPPHDCNVGQGIVQCGEGLSTGVDPGRDELLFTSDDLDFQTDALLGMYHANTTLLTIFSGRQGFCAWQQWSALLGGRAVHASPRGVLPPGVDPAGLLVFLIRDRTVDEVEFEIQDPCGLEITFNPPVIGGPIDVTYGARVSFEETIRVPELLPPGVTSLDCTVRILADGLLIGEQTVHVDVPCRTLTFEGLANGRAIAPADFAQQGLSIRSTPAPSRNVGPAVFDSSPTGPNAGSTDPDLLVGLGNLLILQENNRQTVPGIYDDPDDARLGGELLIDFLAPSQPLSVDLVDIDEASMQSVLVTLLDANGRRCIYTVPGEWTSDIQADGPPGYGTLDLTTVAPQPGFRSTATASEDPGFEIGNVVRLSISLPGSGAIDNLVYCQ